MSWDSYIENLVTRSNGSCDRATIISLDGGESWTPNNQCSLRLQGTEGQKIAQMMKSGDFSSAWSNGIVLEGTKYQFLKGDGEVAFAKSRGFGAIKIQKSISVVVIAHAREGTQQEYTDKAVSDIVGYLKGLGM